MKNQTLNQTITGKTKFVNLLGYVPKSYMLLMFAKRRSELNK